MTVFKHRYYTRRDGSRRLYLDPDYTSEQRSAIAHAADAWRNLCAENAKRFGNTGTCVLGAGIYDTDAGFSRYGPKYMLINAHDVCSYQGNIIWETGMDAILKILTDAGIPAAYYWGSMN